MNSLRGQDPKNEDLTPDVYEPHELYELHEPHELYELTERRRPEE